MIKINFWQKSPRTKNLYSDTEWNRYDSLKAENHFFNALAAWPDDEDNLWILDPANPMDEALRFRLV